MKTFKPLLMLLTVWCLVSCTNNTEMLTEIRPDGSSIRLFSGSADSAFMTGDSASLARRFPVTVDSSWQVIWTYNSGEPNTLYPLSPRQYDSILSTYNPGEDPQKSDIGINRKRHSAFDVVITKKYRSVEEMSRNFRFGASHPWSRVKSTCSLEKRFGWFYTWYHFREVYPRIPTVHTLPIEDFMTDEQARFWFTGTPNLAQGMNGMEMREFVGELEDKYNDWLYKSLWSAHYDAMLEQYNRISNPPVSRDSLATLRDALYSLGLKLSEDEDKSDPKVDMQLVLNHYFKTRVFSELWVEDDWMDSVQDTFEEQDVIYMADKTFTYKLIMPGKITKSEGAVNHGDTLSWALTSVRMIPGDYVLEAHSKKANLWAFVVTGVVLIVAAASFLYRPRAGR